MSKSRPEPEESSLVLNAKQLAEFAKVNPELPALIVKARTSELNRRFVYATASLLAGVLVVFAILGAFVFLVVHGYTTAASALLGFGVLGLVGGFVRSRL